MSFQNVLGCAAYEIRHVIYCPRRVLAQRRHPRIPRVYTCKDKEVSSNLYEVYILGMILQTCFSMFGHIICREPVWSYIIDVCSLFSARDCNVCFSQIFEKRAFSYLNEEEEEESLFKTLGAFDLFCSSCLNFVTLNSSIL